MTQDSPIWERVDKRSANVQYNMPQPTGARWDSPVEPQAQTWLVGEEGSEDATYPVENVLSHGGPDDDSPVRVKNPEAPPFGNWRQVGE